MKKTDILQSDDLTVIIVTFNSAKIIQSCLEKINLKKYRTIIVDNDSNDETLEIVKNFIDEKNIVKLTNNAGYGRANNIGLKMVKTKYALVLNPDAYIFENDISKIIEVMNKNDQIAIAGAIPFKLLDDKEQALIDVSLIRKKNECEEFYYTKFLTGASLFFQIKAFKKIGFFDEKFFLYCEDNEICKRVIKNGYKNALIKNSKFYHIGGNSSERMEVKLNNKILWHRNGWSKAYYFEAVHGVIVGKLKAIIMLLKFSYLIFKDLFTEQKINDQNKYPFLGVLSYTIGIKAFDKDGNPR